MLWYKRLEEGVFKLPRIDGDAKSVELRASELAMMLDGIDLRSVRRVKRFSRKKQTRLKQFAGQRVSFIVVMEDASAITSLPDDPQALKQIILNLSRERDDDRQRDDWHVKFLRVETELLRLKKWYYGPRADRLQTPGEVAQMLLAFATDLESRPVNPEDLPPDEPLAEVGTVRRVRRGRRNLAAFDQSAGDPQGA